MQWLRHTEGSSAWWAAARWPRACGLVVALIVAVLVLRATAQSPRAIDVTIVGAGDGSGSVVSTFSSGVVAGTCTVVAGVTSGACNFGFLSPLSSPRGIPLISLVASAFEGSNGGMTGCTPGGSSCTIDASATVTATFNKEGNPDVDYGDAPLPYPTSLAQGGAGHIRNGGTPFLGECIDWELDGRPDAGALGDDLSIGVPIDGFFAKGCTSTDDEDGIRNLNFPSAGLGLVDVFSSGTCFLDAWIDFNHDGVWTDGGSEQIFSEEELMHGLHHLSFSLPPGHLEGQTFARFRCSREDAFTRPTGLERGGEVEDYLVTIGSGGAPSPVTASFAIDPDNANRVTINVSGGNAIFTPSDKAPATSFRIDARLAPPPALPVVSIPLAVTQSSFTTIAPNGRFFVDVVALNAFGETRSNLLDITVPGRGSGSCNAVPDAPTGLTAQVVGQSVTLTWNASTGCPPTTYILRAGSEPGASNLDPGSSLGGTNPMFFAPNFSSGRYFLRIAARNGAGDSADSADVFVDVP